MRHYILFVIFAILCCCTNSKNNEALLQTSQNKTEKAIVSVPQKNKGEESKKEATENEVTHENHRENLEEEKNLLSNSAPAQSFEVNSLEQSDAPLPTMEVTETTSPAPSKKSKYQISGPYMYENLCIYLLHGEDKIKTKNIITLDEAMASEKIKVYETGTVSQLSVENLTADTAIYLHAGDIVKGGKQDRTIANDMVLLPKTGKKSVRSFCVESGRWSKRAGEKLDQFSSNKYQVASKKLKLAVKYAQNQQQVWNQVRTAQSKLSKNLNTNVQSNVSQTSMQLTLENKKLKEKTQQYMEALRHLASEKSDSVGFIFAINGKLNQADIYGSNFLFSKLWEKLLHSCATEAISEQVIEHQNPQIAQVDEWLAKMRSGKEKARKVNTNSRNIVYQSDSSIGEDVYVDSDLFDGGDEASDFEEDDADDLLHSSYTDTSDIDPDEMQEQNYDDSNNIEIDEEHEWLDENIDEEGDLDEGNEEDDLDD
ncbi:ARPP-1 family domain-containing protein [Candidatus Uabimicrobium amorphum]|uniref:ARG and Rhodanese-Phosphatase-superfamily-associated domain-containing protein n=1 Tax=Uabimicrobium amorphum TaxID=2596890 RepID=A0A5S9INC0_UABAM|nr:DUF6569 family protein [Candidatus Uabimicrobium amorphum]BBM84687.1 hypothetical protein UABAM_03048 [Candidatus Uabimicrobium amorphum]